MCVCVYGGSVRVSLRIYIVGSWVCLNVDCYDFVVDNVQHREIGTFHGA